MMKPETPNLDKMLLVHEVSQQQGLFVDWLRATHNLVLARMVHYTEDDDEDREHECIPACGWTPEHGGETQLNRWLAEFHGIDYDGMEAERRALLAWVRSQQ